MWIQGIHHLPAESQAKAPVLDPWVRTRGVSRRDPVRVLEDDRDPRELQEIRHRNGRGNLVALRWRDFSLGKDVVGGLVGVNRPDIRALDPGEPAQNAAG